MIALKRHWSSGKQNAALCECATESFTYFRYDLARQIRQEGCFRRSAQKAGRNEDAEITEQLRQAGCAVPLFTF